MNQVNREVEAASHDFSAETDWKPHSMVLVAQNGSPGCNGGEGHMTGIGILIIGGAPPAQRRELARPSGPFVVRPAMEFLHTLPIQNGAQVDASGRRRPGRRPPPAAPAVGGYGIPFMACHPGAPPPKPSIRHESFPALARNELRKDILSDWDEQSRRG